MIRRIFIVLFCGVLATPAIVQFASDALRREVPVFLSAFQQLDAAHFRSIEDRLENEWPATNAIRGVAQGLLLGVFREGNEKVFVGPRGWLVYRPGLDAVLGAGPLGHDLGSVARPMPRYPWQPPVPIISDFAGQLRNRGVRLVLVPVPDKVSVDPSVVGAKSSGPVRHPDLEGFYRDLEGAGVEIVRVDNAFQQADSVAPYLKTDTHWNRRGLEIAIKATLDRIGRESAATNQISGKISRAGVGDLARMLAGVKETEFLEVAGEWSEKPAMTGRSDVLVLGDSFVNIYSEAALGFGTGGGFADELARHLGAGVDRIAMNGGGATRVREELARRPELLEGVTTVVWVVAEREFSPNDPQTRSASNIWRQVTLPAPQVALQPRASAKDGRAGGATRIVVRGRVESVSAFPSPGEAPYRDCLGVVMYRVEDVETGDYAEETIPVVHWMFRDEKLLPPSEIVRGELHTLHLEPFDEQPPEVQNLQRVDDSGDLRPLWWVVAWSKD